MQIADRSLESANPAVELRRNADVSPEEFDKTSRAQSGIAGDVTNGCRIGLPPENRQGMVDRRVDPIDAADAVKECGFKRAKAFLGIRRECQFFDNFVRAGTPKGIQCHMIVAEKVCRNAKQRERSAGRKCTPMIRSCCAVLMTVNLVCTAESRARGTFATVLGSPNRRSAVHRSED